MNARTCIILCSRDYLKFLECIGRLWKAANINGGWISQTKQLDKPVRMPLSQDWRVSPITDEICPWFLLILMQMPSCNLWVIGRYYGINKDYAKIESYTAQTAWWKPVIHSFLSKYEVLSNILLSWDSIITIIKMVRKVDWMLNPAKFLKS